MKNIIITESQLKLITEALGVPDAILDAAEEIFDMIAQDLKDIDSVENEYNFRNDVNIVLGDKKKIEIEEFELEVRTENLLKDGSKPEIISMGMGQRFGFNTGIMMKVTQPSTTAEFHMTFAVPDEWEPQDLYNEFVGKRDEHLSSIAHELKHKYDKQAKIVDLIGRDAEYQATQKYGSFGIPAIDHVFMRYLYYIAIAENLVRPVEVASELRSKNITKSQFMDFLNNNRVYKELKEIANYSFEDLTNSLKSQMGRVDALLDHADIDYEDMTDDEKINEVLEIVYATLVNTKMEIFVDMTTNNRKNFMRMFKQLLGGDDEDDEDRDVENLRRKFFNFLVKFKDNPIRFFETEIENFNYIAKKFIKKISKLYAMAKDDEQPVSESIINWELHQQLLEKKYGKRKIETKIRYKY